MRVWWIDCDEAVMRLHRYPDRATLVAISPDGRHVATVDEANTRRFWTLLD